MGGGALFNEPEYREKHIPPFRAYIHDYKQHKGRRERDEKREEGKM